MEVDHIQMFLGILMVNLLYGGNMEQSETGTNTKHLIRWWIPKHSFFNFFLNVYKQTKIRTNLFLNLPLNMCFHV